MAADLLQQLRDIHTPEPPGFWPPAPGWWLLGVVLLAALIWVSRRLLRGYRRRLPVRHARRLYQDIYRRYQEGALSSREYLSESNEVLKRVLIHGAGEAEARRATGQRWLELLDRHLDEPAFTHGPGRALGDLRFRPRVAADVAAVHPLIERLLQRVAPAPPRSRP